jgi:N-methylhydantoinase A/oxoprolinase/acetone carboxylase beta subunit
MGYRVGVDIGGTFTDLCAFDEASNALFTLKVLSTPDRPGTEVMEGLRQLERRYGVAPRAITYFTHGTTVGVNTVIQRKGIRLCLFVTENFVDVLEVARLKMPDPYDLRSNPPEPLVRKDKVLPIRERLRSDGSVDTPLDESSVLQALERARAMGAEGIVIAFINAYRNQVHEHAAKAIVERAAPGLPVFCSTDVWSVIREYERTMTAVIHGYVQPRVAHYLGSLQAALREAGVPATPMVTKSNGGVMSAELGKTACAQMILSGTAAGVIGASFIAGLSGFPKTMSLDVGGTSADVAFIEDGTPQYGVGEMIGEFPISSRPSRSPRSGRAAARSPGSTRTASSRSARKAPARHPGRPATAAAAPGRPSRTRSRCSAISVAASSATARSGSTSTRRVRRSARSPRAPGSSWSPPPRRSSGSRSRACISRSASWCRATASIRAITRSRRSAARVP